MWILSTRRAWSDRKPRRTTESGGLIISLCCGQPKAFVTDVWYCLHLLDLEKLAPASEIQGVWVAPDAQTGLEDNGRLALSRSSAKKHHSEG